MFFKPKEIYKYNILEKYKIDIDKENRSSHNACELVTKDDQYAFYRYKACSDGSGGYILRQEINNPKKVVFFGESKIFNIVYKNHLFQVDKNGELGRFGITARNCSTGQLTKYGWIGQKAVYLVTPDGFGRFYSQDDVDDVYIKDDKLYFKCYREQSLNPGHKETKPDRYDVTAYFTLVVEVKSGKFMATALFDDRDVLSEEEAKKRFLQVKDENWYEEGKRQHLEASKKRLNKGKESAEEKHETKAVATKATINKATIDNPPAKKEAGSIPPPKTQEKKYWIDDKGKVKCPGDACPIDCDLNCPIYAQTMALQKLVKNEFEEAAKLLRIAVATEPKFADAWNNLAACYGQMGDHKNAYTAYQRSYEIEEKPNPLYGMAVATKNMKDYSLAMTYAKIYVGKFGSDDRIKALMVEISENELSEKIMGGTRQGNKNEAPSISESSKATVIPPHKTEKPVAEKITENANASIYNSNAKNDDMHAYGKAFLQLLDINTREAGYAEMEKLESTYPEAGVVLGQYYNGTDQQKAKKHFKIAANAGIAEGLWGYAGIIPHSDIPDDSDVMDKEWVKCCLAAAEGGSADAAHEMGNICHSKGFYEESTYWYGMAYELDHPDGMNSLKGITREWMQKGVSKEFRAYTESFTEERRATALLILELFTQSAIERTLDDLMKLALKGENLAGFMLAEVFEKNNHDDMAYKVYNALAFENHPHALRCYADMLLAGKGTARDIEGAFRFYEQAALAGNAASMFAMGQKAVKAGDKLLAACWFGQAYSRGMEMAGEWLSQLA